MRVTKGGRDRRGASLRCPRCKRIVARLDEAEYRRFACYYPDRVFCTTCHCRCAITEIYGRFVQTIVCNARCMGATSQVCDCSCGGENHARG